MTCREYEPLIALYVEGDLDEPDVERHLAECSSCRELLEDLQASQMALKETAPVDAAFLTAVRSGALAKIERRRMAAWPWVVAFAMAVALILAIPVKPPKISEAAPLVRDQPAARPVEVAKAAPRTRKGRPGGRLRTMGSAPPEPLVVKMLTDDPNIVIIWLIDQKGD